ncbi:MAG: hypothetical protein JXA13_16385 [Anaerolineales bacterium]|nr:hypothetical protein [Anaerolineales bacterium]
MSVKEPIRINNPIPQYSWKQILGIWAAAALPMGLLGSVVSPAPLPDITLITKFDINICLAVLTLRLVWQFVIVLSLVNREAGNLHWEMLCSRLWLQTPSGPRDDQPRLCLWWWVLLLVVLYILKEMFLDISSLWVGLLPFFAEPAGYAFDTVVGSPSGLAVLVALGILSP